MAVMAVTGDIGAGKSTVSKLLARMLGCERLDADVIAQSLWERPDIKAQAVTRWGRDILDVSGNIIRAEAARHIFTSRTEYDFCNSLLHPPVMLALMEHSRNIDAVVEIPLLPEVGRPEWIDTVIYVAADFGIRAERCRIQRGWSIGELERRENFLLPREQRVSISNYIIHNNTTKTELERQTGEIIIHEYKRSTREKEHTRQRQMES